MSRLSIDEKIEQLDSLDFDGDPEGAKAKIKTALQAKHNISERSDDRLENVFEEFW